MYRGCCGLRGPVFWWVCLYPQLVCFLTWGVPTLEFIGWGVGPDLGAKMSDSRRAHTGECSPICFPPVSMSPRWTTATPTSSKYPPRGAGSSCPGSYQITIFALGPDEHEILCIPFKGEVSVYPSLVELLQSSPADLQSQMLWRLLFSVLDPQVWGPVGKPLHHCSPICCFPTQRIWNLIISWVFTSCLSYCCSFSMSLDLFWCFPVFFINGYFAVSCDFGVLMKEGELRDLLLYHLTCPTHWALSRVTHVHPTSGRTSSHYYLGDRPCSQSPKEKSSASQSWFSSHVPYLCDWSPLEKPIPT